MNIRFIIIAMVLFLIVLLSEYVTYISLHTAGIISSARVETILMSLGIIFPLIFIITMAYSYKHYSVFNSWLNTVSSIWLGILLYVFIASVIIALLVLINYYFGLMIPIKIISGILIILTLALVTYGVINADNPRIVKWEVKSEKLSRDWSGKKIIMISDVHLGTMRGEGFLKNVVDKINKENPDVVFIVGDLIDGSSFPYEKWLSEFSSLKPQFGIFYVEGNHEKYSQEYDKFKSAIPPYINNLSNKKIIVNNTQIIGLDYKMYEMDNEINKELETLQYDKNQPSIVLIHDPRNNSDLSKEGASLILSGHTHNGQIFPGTLLIDGTYKQYAHGVSYTGNTVAVTGAGVGTAIIPIRIGTIPEIVELTIK